MKNLKNHSLNFNQDYGILKMRHYMTFNNPVKGSWLSFITKIYPLKKSTESNKEMCACILQYNLT